MLEQHSFQEVMRQFDRMCKAHAGCVDCPLAVKGSIETKCSIGSFIDESEYVEREIMQWAAEHPEPVYPTWMEYLESIKVIVPRKNYTVMDTYSLIIGQIKTTRISADIAQKLGIEPVPVVHGDCGATNATDARKKLGL